MWYEFQFLVTPKRNYGNKHEDTHERQYIVPAIFLEQYKQEATTYERGCKTAKRLHTIYQSLVLLPKGKYGKGIGSYILRSRCHERQEDKRENEVLILMQIEMPHEENYCRIDTFAYEDATAITFHRVTSTVNHWRPQELEHPRQFD